MTWRPRSDDPSKGRRPPVPTPVPKPWKRGAGLSLLSLAIPFPASPSRMLNRKGLLGRTRIASCGSLLFILASPLLGQGTERKPDHLVGEATAVDSAARRLTVKSDNGGSVLVTVPEGAPLLRPKPVATPLADATPLGLEQIPPRDRV